MTTRADSEPTSAGDAMDSDTDVLIVGAGPAGLTLALLLARRGRTVAVYERWAGAYPLPRAAAMSHETVRTFQAAGVLDRLRDKLNLDHPRLTSTLYAPDGEALTTMPFPGAGESGYPPMVGFHQPDVDGALGELCADHPLVSVHRGWDARAVDQDGDAAVVTFGPVDGDQARAGEPVRARGRFVVGCDGANSTVRSLMATGVTDTGFASSWLVVDTFVNPGAAELDLFGHVLDPERPATLASAGNGRQRFEFMILDGDDPERITADDAVWRLLARWDTTPERVTLARRAVYTFRGRWADSWRDGRVLLAGDAAHQMPPFLGQGFNSGIRDTIALAWRIDLILAGKAGLAVLDGYPTERLEHVRQIVRTSVAVGELMCATDPQVAADNRERLLAPGDGPDAMPQPQWRLGPGCLLPGDPAAGFLAHQGRVERDGTGGLFDELVGTGSFLLIGDGVDPLAGLSEDAGRVWSQLDGRAATIGPDGLRDVDGTYRAWFAQLGASVVLVRPDFQVYGAAADPGRADAMVLSLAEQLHLRATVASARYGLVTGAAR